MKNPSFFFYGYSSGRMKRGTLPKGILLVLCPKSGGGRGVRSLGGQPSISGPVYIIKASNGVGEVNTCVLFWVGGEEPQEFWVSNFFIVSVSFSDCPHIGPNKGKNRNWFIVTRKEEQLQRWPHLLETWRRAKLSWAIFCEWPAKPRTWRDSNELLERNRCRVDENHTRNAFFFLFCREKVCQQISRRLNSISLGYLERDVSVRL